MMMAHVRNVVPQWGQRETKGKRDIWDKKESK